jgi:hypothetical protein
MNKYGIVGTHDAIGSNIGFLVPKGKTYSFKVFSLSTNSGSSDPIEYSIGTFSYILNSK